MACCVAFNLVTNVVLLALSMLGGLLTLTDWWADVKFGPQSFSPLVGLKGRIDLFKVVTSANIASIPIIDNAVAGNGGSDGGDGGGLIAGIGGARRLMQYTTRYDSEYMCGGDGQYWMPNGEEFCGAMDQAQKFIYVGFGFVCVGAVMGLVTLVYHCALGPRPCTKGFLLSVFLTSFISLLCVAAALWSLMSLMGSEEDDSGDAPPMIIISPDDSEEWMAGGVGPGLFGMAAWILFCLVVSFLSCASWVCLGREIKTKERTVQFADRE
ncbi:unnamed protein product [Effrenium voratum]|nr:unnamed protein product [Effrenium voratum]